MLQNPKARQKKMWIESSVASAKQFLRIKWWKAVRGQEGNGGMTAAVLEETPSMVAW